MDSDAGPPSNGPPPDVPPPNGPPDSSSTETTPRSLEAPLPPVPRPPEAPLPPDNELHEHGSGTPVLSPTSGPTPTMRTLARRSPPRTTPVHSPAAARVRPIGASPRRLAFVEFLGRYKDMHLAYAAMHNEAARHMHWYHTLFTVLILVLSLVATVLDNTLSLFSEASVARQVISTIGFGMLAGFTSINNFLGYQKLEEKHIAVKNEHLNAMEVVDAALVHVASSHGEYDYSVVEEELQSIHRNLRKTGVTLPYSIARRYPEYEAPWQLKRMKNERPRRCCCPGRRRVSYDSSI